MEAQTVEISSAQPKASQLVAKYLAHDLAAMDEIAAFAQSLPKRHAGTSPTNQQIRELAYEERECEDCEHAPQANIPS